MKPKHEYRVTVVGPGAIGSLYAARLAKAGYRVHLLDHQSSRAAQLNRSGISVEEDETVWSAYPEVTADPGIVVQADLIIVCVKAYSTRALCQQLSPRIKADTAILSLQNGLGNMEALLNLPVNTVLAGVTGAGARLSTPGHVQCTGDGTTWVATARGDTSAAENVATLLRTAGVDTRCHPNLHIMLWTKLILNAAINPLTAYYRLLNGELLNHPKAGPRARQIVTEAVAVAAAAGIPLNETDLWTTLETVCRLTALNSSSMRRDVEQNRQNELNAITGAIIKEADAHNIAVPNNRWIYKKLSGEILQTTPRSTGDVF